MTVDPVNSQKHLSLSF